MSDKAGKNAVISISSHVARGSVGNRASVFALETFGFPVWSVPTITLPWHPGHSPATKIVPDTEQFKAFMGDIITAPWVSEIEAILTGYMANPEQATIVSDAIMTLRERDPELIVICDPVIGDSNGTYVAEETAIAIRDQLFPLCDIATPNVYELDWLLGKGMPKNIDEVAELARIALPPFMLVTSVYGKADDEIGNLFVSEKETLFAGHPIIESPPKGPGDLTAAIFLANLLSGLEFKDNLKETTASVFEVLQNATERGSDELMLETDIASLLDPSLKINVTEV